MACSGATIPFIPPSSWVTLNYGFVDLDRLRLCADLVTLSGCSTGVSVVTGGDGLLGLMRGVLTAGARALLATLWDVSDEATAIFMAAFYRNLFRDATFSPAQALRTTMVEMI
jgi:CHAT domain-containing protein